MNRTSHTIALYPAGDGPILPESFSRVIFRITREKELRVFDPRTNPATKDYSGISAQSWCKDFIDLRCRAFVKLDGYNPLTKEYKAIEIISQEVDMFYCDHPEVKL